MESILKNQIKKRQCVEQQLLNFIGILNKLKEKKMKKALMLAMIFIAFSMTYTMLAAAEPTACGSDDYEKNNSLTEYWHWSDTTGSAINKTLNAKICPSGDMDFYGIILPFQNNCINVSLTNLPKNYNLYLIRNSDLWSPFNLKSENSGTSDENIQAEWPEGCGLESGGNRIFVYVVGIGGAFDENQDYTLSISITNCPPKPKIEIPSIALCPGTSPTLNIKNIGGGSLVWDIKSDDNNVSFDPNKGTVSSNGNVPVKIILPNCPDYSKKITITSNDESKPTYQLSPRKNFLKSSISTIKLKPIGNKNFDFNADCGLINWQIEKNNGDWFGIDKMTGSANSNSTIILSNLNGKDGDKASLTIKNTCSDRSDDKLTIDVIFDSGINPCCISPTQDTIIISGSSPTIVSVSNCGTNPFNLSIKPVLSWLNAETEDKSWYFEPKQEKKVTFTATGGDNEDNITFQTDCDNESQTTIVKHITPPCTLNPYVYKKFLQFKLKTGDAWCGAGPNQIKVDNNDVSINEILKFHGSMIIDTTMNFEKIANLNGEFYFDKINLPGTNTPQKFTLYKGSYDNLPLNNDSLKFSTIDSEAIAKSKSKDYFCGIKVIPRYFKVWGFPSLNQVGIGADVWIQNTKNCGDRRRRFSFNGDILFDINSNINLRAGFTGMEIIPNVCLKTIGIIYDNSAEEIGFEASLWTPFFGNRTSESNGVSLSVLLKKKLFEKGSFSATVDPKLSIPIGNTTLGFRGLGGSISGINEPPFNLCLTAFLVSRVNPDLLDFQVEGCYKAPSYLELGVKDLKMGKFGDIWQIRGEAKIIFDWNYYLGINGTINAGTLDNETFVVNSEGKLKLVWNPSMELTGTLNGTLQIPKLEDKWPFDWINSLIGLPFPLANTEIFFKFPILKGNADFMGFLGQWNFCINISKIGKPGYFELNQGLAQNLNSLFLSNRNEPSNKIQDNSPYSRSYTLKSSDRLLSNEFKDTLKIEDVYQTLIIRIKSMSGIVPKSYLINPQNKKITETQPDSLIIYSTSKNSSTWNAGYWTLTKPAYGYWIFVAENTQPTDSITIVGIKNDNKPEFALISKRDNNDIVLNWQPYEGNKDTVDFFIDDNNSGYNGIYIGSAKDSTGIFKFHPNDTLPFCNFYIYGIRSLNGNISKAYLNEMQEFTKSRLHAPIDIHALYFNSGPDSGLTLVKYKIIDSPDINGYTIFTIDKTTGSEEILDQVFPYDSIFYYNIANPLSKKIKIIASDTMGLTGCPSYEVPITDDVNNEWTNPFNSNNKIQIKVYPNPFNSSTTIKYYLPETSPITMRINNYMGIEIYRIFDKEMLNEGTHSYELNMGNYPSGIYYITINSGEERITEKIVLIK